MPKDEKLYKISGRKTDNKQGSKEAIDALDGQIHYQVAASSRKRCNSCSILQVVKDDTSCNNNRDVSRRISKTFQR